MDEITEIQMCSMCGFQKAQHTNNFKICSKCDSILASMKEGHPFHVVKNRETREAELKPYKLSGK